MTGGKSSGVLLSPVWLHTAANFTNSNLIWRDLMYKKEYAAQRDVVQGVYQYLVAGFSEEEAIKYEEWFEHPYDIAAFERWVGAEISNLIRQKWFEWILHHDGEIERPEIDDIYSAIIAPKKYQLTPPLDLPAVAPARYKKMLDEWNKHGLYSASLLLAKQDEAPIPAVSKTCSELIRSGAVA